MSHSRFWAVHVLFTAFPVLFFYAYAIQKTNLIKKYRYNKSKLSDLERRKDDKNFDYTYDACMHALDYKRTKKRDKRLRRVVSNYTKKLENERRSSCTENNKYLMNIWTQQSLSVLHHVSPLLP